MRGPSRGLMRLPDPLRKLFPRVPADQEGRRRGLVRGMAHRPTRNEDGANAPKASPEAWVSLGGAL